ncbi:hypothetical protein FRC17_007923 [Serendipita sp. 399]|nr:hypothetical protein FRC17_007923 [Serendipita sp. 399]
MGISTLPAELLQRILSDAALGSERVRRVLLAVCFQWRDILLRTPEIWTYIRVVLTKTHISGQEFRFQNGLSILKLDLQRAGSHLLDVYWDVEVDQEHIQQIFDVIQAQAPFDRWKSLVISKDYWEGYTPTYLSGDHGFLNLTSLEIHQYRPDGFLPLIGRTISSCFCFFYVTDSDILPNLFAPPLSNILSKATVMLLPGLKDHLQATAHIQQLIVEGSTLISQFVDRDWSSLGWLDVNFRTPSSRNLLQTPLISLPRLHILSVRGGYFQPLAHFSAPQLAHLRVSQGNKGLRRANQNLYSTVSQQTYTLSPVGKLQVDFPLEPLVLARVIAQSPAVESLAMRVEDLDAGWDAIRQVICERKWDEDVAVGSENLELELVHPDLMQRLDTLEIHIDRLSDKEARDIWDAHMAEILEATPGTQLETITCHWLGGVIRRLRRSVSIYWLFSSLIRLQSMRILSASAKIDRLGMAHWRRKEKTRSKLASLVGMAETV